MITRSPFLGVLGYKRRSDIREAEITKCTFGLISLLATHAMKSTSFHFTWKLELTQFLLMFFLCIFAQTI